MAMNNQIKLKLKTVDPGDDHPYLCQLSTSFLIASTMTPIILPIDFVKSRIQMDVALQDKRLPVVVKSLLQQYGFRRFYAGLGIVFIHSCFQATMKGIVADRIFSSHQNLT